MDLGGLFGEEMYLGTIAESRGRWSPRPSASILQKTFFTAVALRSRSGSELS